MSIASSMAYAVIQPSPVEREAAMAASGCRVHRKRRSSTTFETRLDWALDPRVRGSSPRAPAHTVSSPIFAEKAPYE
jgi:hypothetical protein